ncbi:MAG TPA: hypothetical protein VLG28_07145 [Acidimicrobiia bacterium]|jgi:hypothetical protein|nr:hypothetical protein [Acidimicrobiia bacterium]
MTTSSQAIYRRTRRRRQLAIFLTLAVIAAVIALAARYRTERRETMDYLALVDEVAQEHLVISQSLRELFDTLGSLDRPDIVERIGMLGSQAEESVAQLETAVVTRPAAEVHGLFSVAVRSWATGVSNMDEAVVEVMDQPDDATVSPDSFVGTVTDLRVGDEAYAAFLDAVLRLDEEFEPPVYPDVAYLGGPEPADVEAIASRLRLRRSFTERHDVAVTANTRPEPTGDRNGVAIMPFSETFDVTAIVTNRGNVPQEEIEVMLLLTADGTTEVPPFEERRFLPSLAPDASMSLEFAGLAMRPGTLYTLRVTASIADDADVENNVWEVAFASNAE